MTLRIRTITFDCADPYLLAGFWSRVTGYREDPDNSNHPDDPEGLLVAPDERTVAPLVKAYCVDTYLHAAGENIQIHGGIGFTWEHPAHLYLKRAKSSQVLLGDSDFHRQQLADRIGI